MDQSGGISRKPAGGLTFIKSGTATISTLPT
jgi:hypothetical protein